MKIVHLTPGSGNTFYCENCFRDAALARALRKMGAEAFIVPMYLPSAAAASTPIFFGGINVFLQQHLRLFRRTPPWLDRLFDATPLLRLAARLAGATSAAALAATTLSMLRGAHGRQNKELDRLADYLAEHVRPEVVVLSNALLAGLAGPLRRRLGAAVVCLLQDEDSFLDDLGEGPARQAWDLLRRCAADIDVFLPVSDYYRRVMAQRLGLDGRDMPVLTPGVDVADYDLRDSPPAVPTVGYLSRMCADKGLATLVEACILLRRRPGLERLRLAAAGGHTAQDRPYLHRLRRRLAAAGLLEETQLLPTLDEPAKRAFLRSLSVLSVPSVRPEALGLYVLEAFAAGVPVVAPRHGGVVELLEASGAGLLTPPNDPHALADALGRVLTEPLLAAELSQRGRLAAGERFTVERAARRMLEVCRGLAERKTGSARGATPPAALPAASETAGGAVAAPLLEIRGLSKRYDGDAAAPGPVVLEEVNLTLSAGEALAIVGPSGSGKSTLLNIIGALDRPSGGSVRIAGHDVSGLDDAAAAELRNRLIGFVFQLHHLLPQCTALENVLLPVLPAKAGPWRLSGAALPEPLSPAAAAERAKDLLERVGLGDRLHARPGELSGGQRQRVALVRAIINRPRLLLADEPTGSLDHAAAEDLAELLMELNAREGVAMIVVTHSRDLAGRMPRRLVLRDGRLSPAEAPR